MEQKAGSCCITQVIKGNGTFNAYGLNTFIKQVKLGECGLQYAIVSVLGPQSGGKSTLLNRLFYTNFEEMDASKGRNRTTNGIWIARCTDIKPCTIVFDLEGTDGQERGEDDTAFEKQSALFALAVSDIVMINMWCNDIGREQAAGKPLLKTVFQEMLRLFSPRKKTLVFVIRDKTETPFELLEKKLKEDIDKIWDSIHNPKAYNLREFFNVEVVALSSYRYEKENFNQQVASLRQKLVQSIGGLASDDHRRGVVPASDFSLSTKKIWETIKENKDLKLPAHMIMVATIRCEEIASEKYSSFAASQDWIELEKDVNYRHVPGFGKKISSLLDKCLSSYDKEAIHYDGDVRSAKRSQLSEKLKQLVKRLYEMMFERIRSEALDNFKAELKSVSIETARQQSIKRYDELCEDVTCKQVNWDSTRERDLFICDLNLSYTTEVQAAKREEITALYEKEKKKKTHDRIRTTSAVIVAASAATLAVTSAIAAAPAAGDVGGTRAIIYAASAGIAAANAAANAIGRYGNEAPVNPAAGMATANGLGH